MRAKNAKLANGEKVSYTEEERTLMKKRTELRKIAKEESVRRNLRWKRENPYNEDGNYDLLNEETVPIEDLVKAEDTDGGGFDLGMAAGAIPLDKVWDTVKPLVKDLIPKGKMYRKDVQKAVIRRFRQPYWDEALQPISRFLHDNVERATRKVSNTGIVLIHHLQKLPKDIQEAAIDLRYKILDPEAPEYGPLLKTKTETNCLVVRSRYFIGNVCSNVA